LKQKTPFHNSIPILDSIVDFDFLIGLAWEGSARTSIGELGARLAKVVAVGSHSGTASLHAEVNRTVRSTIKLEAAPRYHKSL